MVPTFLLGARGRLFAYAGGGVGLILDAPRFGGGFVRFLATPAGLALAGGVLGVIGITIEETGTLARIRAGIALRLLGPLLLIGAAAWTLADGRTPGMVFALAAAVVAIIAAHDAALLRDLRHGQHTRLESVAPAGVTLSVRGTSVILPLDALAGAELAASGEGRGVFLVVTSRERIQGDSARLPWASSGLHHDALVLTEHQCNLDARTVVARVRDAIAVGKSGYR